MFAVFPVAMASFIMILHPRIGGPAAASVLAHAQPPLVGLPLAFLAVHYLAVPVGAGGRTPPASSSSRRGTVCCG